MEENKKMRAPQRGGRPRRTKCGILTSRASPHHNSGSSTSTQGNGTNEVWYTIPNHLQRNNNQEHIHGTYLHVHGHVRTTLSMWDRWDGDGCGCPPAGEGQAGWSRRDPFAPTWYTSASTVLLVLLYVEDIWYRYPGIPWRLTRYRLSNAVIHVVRTIASFFLSSGGWVRVEA